MVATQTANVVRMVSQDGQVFFYTGRAGSGWVSQNLSDAFTYQTIEGARNKACVINRMTPIHGFHAIGWEPR